MSAQRLELKTRLALPILLGILFAFPITALALVGAGKIGGLIILGACLTGYIWLCVRLASRRLILDESGITQKGAFSQQQIAWNDVEYYTYWSMEQNTAYAAGAQGGLIGMLVAAAVVAAINSGKNKETANRRFRMGRLKIVSRDRRDIAISPRYVDAGEAVDQAFTELHARLRNAPRRDYDPFVLTPNDLTHKTKGSLGLADIEKITVANSHLSVKKRDKRLKWVGVHMKNITNGMLFIEDLAEHGIIVDARAGVFVPPTVLEKLHAAASRQAALPKARIVER